MPAPIGRHIITSENVPEVLPIGAVVSGSKMLVCRPLRIVTIKGFIGANGWLRG